MNVLVIGGTVFLGRAMVAAAQARGADVTIFNRGRSGPAPAGVTSLTGDRTVEADLAQLRGRHFDVVIDTCGFVPADVARSAAVLAPTCSRYVFVSSISVFPGWPEAQDYHAVGAYAGDPDATADDVPDGIEDGGGYGWLKAGCELAAAREFGPERAVILRGGCIVGPYDSVTGRLPWWIARVSRGGEVLVPGSPDDPISLVDARDLAEFALTAPGGSHETAGPRDRDTRADLMNACRDVTRSGASFTYVADDWLAAQAVEPWTEVPLWAPGAPSLFRHGEAVGMRWRPLAQTVADTWEWQTALPGGWGTAPRTPGLDQTREADLLATWKAGTG